MPEWIHSWFSGKRVRFLLLILPNRMPEGERCQQDDTSRDVDYVPGSAGEGEVMTGLKRMPMMA